MSTVASNAITVFPSTKRGSTQRSARLISEENLVNIINKLVDKDSFVVSTNDGLSSISPFMFNIHGYLFTVSALSNITTSFSSANEIYAYIITETNDGYTELKGQDADSQYNGVNFVSAISDFPAIGATEHLYSLQILQKVSGSWVIPNASMVKYNGVNIFGDVDGGEV